MKLIFASSPSHDLLKQHIFLGTLCENWELVDLRFDLAGTGDFRSPTWRRVVADRNLRLLEIVRKHPGEVVVHSDVDIQWFRPCQEILLRELADKDIVFLREMPGREMINFGFSAMRCNERTVALLEQVVEVVKQRRSDQGLVNELITRGAMPCRYGILPHTFMSDNLDGVHAPPNSEIVMYHSINTFPAPGKSSLQLKLERHLAMRARVLGSPSVFRSVPTSIPQVKAPPIRQTSDFGTLPQNYTIQFPVPQSQSKPPLRCNNLIIHSIGRLYGEVTKVGCYQWRFQDGRMAFLDGSGRVRFEFERADSDAWRRCGVAAQPECLLVPQPPVETDRKRFEMVVARYREDITWATCYPENLTVYSKGGEIRDMQSTPLPNLGREGGTYLFHIVEHYERLADRTLFLQGNPFAHPLLPLAEFANGTDPFVTGPSRESAMTWSPSWTEPPQLIDEPAMRAFLELLECDPTIGSFRWVQGAQFAITREQIHKRPRRYYEKLFEITQQDWVLLAGRNFNNHHVAWLFELFWRFVFRAEAAS